MVGTKSNIHPNLFFEKNVGNIFYPTSLMMLELYIGLVFLDPSNLVN